MEFTSSASGVCKALRTGPVTQAGTVLTLLDHRVIASVIPQILTPVWLTMKTALHDSAASYQTADMDGQLSPAALTLPPGLLSGVGASRGLSRSLSRKIYFHTWHGNVLLSVTWPQSVVL